MLTWYGRPRGGGIKAQNFAAKWQDVNSDLELTYITFKEDPTMAGQKALVKVVDKSETALTLQFPDGSVYRLNKRVKRRHLNSSEIKLTGKWLANDKRKSIWDLSSRGFIIRGFPPQRRDRQTLASGNWRIENDVLILTYVNDREIYYKTKRAGEVDRLKILFRDSGKIILQPVAGGQQVVLLRER
jgi:hypothetical protein